MLLLVSYTAIQLGPNLAHYIVLSCHQCGNWDTKREVEHNVQRLPFQTWLLATATQVRDADRPPSSVPWLPLVNTLLTAL